MLFIKSYNSILKAVLTVTCLALVVNVNHANGYQNGHHNENRIRSKSLHILQANQARHLVKPMLETKNRKDVAINLEKTETSRLKRDRKFIKTAKEYFWFLCYHNVISIQQMKRLNKQTLQMVSKAEHDG